jgi:hypothetical protein
LIDRDFATDWLRARLRLVGPAGGIGVFLAVIVAILARVLGWPAPTWIDSTFAFGGLWFGFGLLTWAISIMLGRTIEGLQSQMDLSTRWTERKSRRAMARVTAFGAGLMIGTTILGSLL